MFAEDEYKQYLLLGGMPEVVADYSINHNFGQCREILTRIHSTYIEDISKYEKSETWRKYLETVVTEGPRVAGSIFNYENFAGSSYKSREMSEALRKVEKTMLCKQLPVINSTILPVIYKQKRSKKLIWLDVGIVNLINNIYPELLTGVYGGKLMEQIVGQTLLAIMSNNLIKLAYFAKDRDMGSAEVDFCFPWKQYLVGIEVKSGDNLNSKSLTSMIKSGEGRVVPIKVSWGKLEVKNGIINIPFYLLERWEYFV
jgi:predicted AAA+ superfamily ATPase